MDKQNETQIYLGLLKQIEETACDLDDAIAAIEEHKSLAETSKARFRAWFFNDSKNFGIGATYHNIPPGAAISVHPTQNDRVFQFCVRSIAAAPLIVRMGREEALRLAYELIASVENPTLSKKIHELQPITSYPRTAGSVRQARGTLSTPEALGTTRPA